MIGGDVVRIGGGAPHSPPRSVTEAGTHIWPGPGVSVMIWTQVAELQPSVAVQVRVIVAPCGHWPEVTSLYETSGVAPQLSVAVAVPVTDGSVGVPHGSVKSGGQVSTGAVVSWTVIVCVQ